MRSVLFREEQTFSAEMSIFLRVVAVKSSATGNGKE